MAEHRIEDRLTDGGGTADVSLDAFPAARLLFGDGTKLSVTGSGLDLDLAASRATSSTSSTGSTASTSA